MNVFRMIVLAVGLAGAPAFSAPPAELGPLLVAGVNDAQWNSRFERLAPNGSVLSQFTERRYFPFRKRPTVLGGEMRLHPQHGLSLRYVEPEERILIIDDDGMLQRDARGRSRAVPADPHATTLNAALLPVLRFDRAAIARSFDIHAAEEGEDWRLDFVPRDAALARTLGRLTAWGRGDALERLEFHRSQKQRVEIIIESAQRDAVFDDAELKRFFR